MTIKGDITGLKPGEHNVHIAELGYTNDGISSSSTWLNKLSTSPVSYYHNILERINK